MDSIPIPTRRFWRVPHSLKRWERPAPDSLTRRAPTLRVAVTLLPATLFYIAPACATEITPSLTGIPVEYLFASIGVLVTLVYGGIRRDIRTLLHDDRQRARQIKHVENAVRTLCNTLNVHYRESDDE